ncbi:hypothetical protein BSL78_01486 [Apostichopus japonicus]|uniref:Uncharacterized protein n=1 Tax=Stichopus japonicus TaxID=307972 RepID=A0A2G8LMS5_STIJA|nr:hypothetical protein BSL78_01486 [Apostichopus japonicus]
MLKPVRQIKMSHYVLLTILIYLMSTSGSKSEEQGDFEFERKLNTYNGVPNACDVCYCNETWRIVNCTMPIGKQPNPFPANFPKWTEVINIKDNNIDHIPYSSLMALPQLKYLYAAHNKIGNIFLLPDVMKHVDLTHNELRDVGEMIKGKSELLYLNLRENRIRELSPVAFQGCWKLKYLHLKYNPIRAIQTSTFGNLSSLLTLELTSQEGLESIAPNSFDDLCSLEELEFGEGEFGPATLENIPSGLFQTCGQNIRQLTIQNTRWRRIENDFLDGVREAQLTFSRNQLEWIGENAFAKTTLILWLNLGQNKLDRLHPMLFRNTSIRAADLSENLLYEIPEDLFKNQTELVSLLLQRNKFKTISASVFADLNNLMELTLFHGELEEIEDGAFRNTKLKTLYLFGNRLKAIGGGIFTTSEGSLNNIHMYLNPIENITDEALQALTKNATIFTSCGHLVSIPALTREEVQLKCVPDSFVGTFPASPYFADAFRHDGFDCYAAMGKRHAGWLCQPCPVGTYGNRRHHGCLKCPAGGFYQDIPGTAPRYSSSFGCKHCTNGTYVPYLGGKSHSDCIVCPSGTNQSLHAGFRACYCADGYYRTDRFGPCKICTDEGVSCSNDIPLIKNGYARNFTTLRSANEELFGLVCENLMKDDIEASQTQVSYKGFEMPKANKCPRPESCLTKDGLETHCAPGYEGWLCTVCSTTYYPVFDQCLRCPSNPLRNFLLECAFLVGIVFSLGLFAFRRYKLSSNEFFDVLIAQGKIFLGFYQVMGGLFSALDDVNWPFSTAFSRFLHLVELNIFQIFAKPQYCVFNLRMDPYFKFTFGFAVAISTILFFLGLHYMSVIYFLWKDKTTRISRISEADAKVLQKIKEWCSLVTFLVLFMLYPSLCSVTFEIAPWACESFNLSIDSNATAEFVRSDLRFRCDDEDLNYNHNIFNKVFFVGFSCIVAFPLITVVLLKRNLKTELSCNETTPLLSTASNNNNTEMTSHYPRWCQFLTKNYKARFWYWEMLEILRKMIQICFLTIFGAESGVCFVITIIISICFAIAHTASKPMQEHLKVEHWLQVFSLIAISFNLVIFFGLSYDENITTDANTKTILILMLYALNAFLITAILDILNEVQKILIEFLES